MTLFRILFTGFILFVEYYDCVHGANVKFYRDDYKLIDKYNVFYKYHNNMENWQRAKEICENEGASLFKPDNEKQMNAILSLFDIHYYLHVEAFNSLENFNNIKIDYSTTEEDCLHLNIDDSTIMRNCYRRANILCQKMQASVQWNDVCDMPVYSQDGNDYEYDSKLNNCYKLHALPNTWHKAVEICKAEQAELTELNSREEADHLVEIVTRVPEKEVGVVCLGFQKVITGWKMLSGKFLHESGYPMWAHTQPDGGNFELYGAMAYNGRLHDIGENARCVFVCERDVRRSK